MNFNSVLENAVFELPKSYNSKTTFRKYLKKIYKEYIDLLKGVEPKLFQVNRFKNKTNLNNIIEKQEEFIAGILETIDLYFEGKPALAFFKFKDVMEKRQNSFKTMLSTNKFSINENFYRIRTCKENFPFSNNEMFHIDFENRGKVSTQRYSIPGFPSLYISKTLYVAWEELNRPNINDFQAIRLTNKEEITYLDLTSQNINIDSDEIYSSTYKYLMTFPLIAACSIKVKNYDDKFKPEYIIPQILLQWIRENNRIDAIKYSSTHINLNEKKLMGDLYNIVMPVKENKDEGHCSVLKNIFLTTETISKQFMDFSSGGRIFLRNDEEYNAIDKKIPKIELVIGKKLPYSFSVLGKMEMLLDEMQIKKIK